MAQDYGAPEDSNRSANPSIHEVSDPARRQWLKLSTGAAAAAVYGPLLSACASLPPRLGFAGVPPSTADSVVVPAGYVAQVIAPWGEPVGVPGAMPAWKPDASNSAAEQALQLGMHLSLIHI